MLMRRTTILTLSLFFAPAFIGCAGSRGNGADSKGDATGARLEIVGPESRELRERAEEDLAVKYLDADGNPVGEQVIDWGIVGAAADASLSGRASTTDADGIAMITLRAGHAAAFEVEAVASAVDPASIDITVREPRFGTLSYRVTYGGERYVKDVEAALFTNTTCRALDDHVPAPREVQYPALRATESFEDVEQGVPMAVYAFGIDTRDNVAAQACTDVELESSEAHIDIPLQDMEVRYAGRYQTEETFDVTEGFNSTLDAILDAMRGLSEDPAAYIVDVVRDGADTPDWLKEVLAFGPSRALIVAELDRLLDEIHPPGYLTDTLSVGAELDRGLSAMTLIGELTLEEPDEFTEFEGHHRVHTLELPLMSGTVERPVESETALTASIVDDRLTLDEHALELEFGRLVETLLNEVLLPRAPGAPSDVTDLVSDVFDCEAIAMRVDESWEREVEAICSIGTELLGRSLENWIRNLWDYDTLHLQGTATLEDSDRDYDMDRITDGESQARWTGESGEMSFPGTLVGERLEDETGRPHPVRQRMHGLL